MFHFRRPRSSTAGRYGTIQLTQTIFWLTLKDMTTEDKWIFVAAAALVVLVVLLLTGHLHIFGHHHFWRR